MGRKIRTRVPTLQSQRNSYERTVSRKLEKKTSFDRCNFVKNFSELYPWESVWLMLQIVGDAVLDKHGPRRNPQMASWGKIGANWTPTGNIRKRKKGWFPMAGNFYVCTCVKFTFANKIEAMQAKTRQWKSALRETTQSLTKYNAVLRSAD